MNPYWVAYRLYLPWFPLTWLTGVFFVGTPLSIIQAGVIHALLYPAIYLVHYPFTKRYRFYFNNQGLSLFRMFVLLCMGDLAAFLLLVSCLKFVVSCWKPIA